MAYPVIVNSITTATTSGTAMNLPASIVSGNLLVLAIAHREASNGAVTSVAGFTEQADDGTTSHLAIYTRTADGTEGSTVTATFAGSGHTAATCWQVSGWDGFVASAANQGTSATHNPASISTGVGSRECLMFALDASQSQTVTVSTYPSGYTNTASLRSAVSGSAIRLNSATLEVTASSEDPGAFTLSGATNGAVGGILIYAAAGAGSFTSTGALTGPGSTVSGSAKLGFVSTGALTGQGSAVAGTATRVFTATGALVGPGSVIAGSAQVSTGFTSTGALVGQGSTVSGTATRLFTATGALVGAGSAVAGTATRVFTAAGTLAGPGASLSGAATNGIFSASGALIGQGSIIAGTATKTNNFTAVGALVGQGSVLSGTAKRVFTGTGSLVGQGATIAGVASVAGLHSSTGALVGSGAILAGEAEQPDVVSYSITYTIEYNDLPYIILAAGAAILTVDDGPIRSYL